MSARKRNCPCCHFGYVGGPHDKPCCVPELERLRAENADLKRRIRIAKRALRRSTKYEPWDDFEWTASIALDLRRKDFVRRPLPKVAPKRTKGRKAR